jgi:hypothetical protein
MTYHMARVAEWIQHGNVDYYPTSIDRQNYQMPLAEFCILHFQLLTQSDAFANTVQWMSFCVSIILAGLLTAELGGSQAAQILSAVVAATIPMAILQSSSTQNDLVVSVFCMSFAYFLLRTSSLPNRANVFFSAISLGMSLLAKGTSFFYCGAIGVVFGLAAILRSGGYSKKLKTICILAIIVCIGFLVNLSSMRRNFILYGQPVESPESYFNEDISFRTLFSNVIRNTALHLGTPSSKVNGFILSSVRNLLGDQLESPKTTFMGNKFLVEHSCHEDRAGNFHHLMLAFFSVLLLPVYITKKRREVTLYAAAVILGALTFCMALKWQPWGSRLHTPIFMLSAPLVGLVVSSVPKRLRSAQIITVLLLLFSIPYLIINNSRPLIPPSLLKFSAPGGGRSLITTSRTELYFWNRPSLCSDYVDAIRFIEGEKVSDIGLYLGEDDWEYPLWMLANKDAAKSLPFFRHVAVKDISRKLESNTSMPLLVLATQKTEGNIIGGKQYYVVFESKSINVLRLGE